MTNIEDYKNLTRTLNRLEQEKLIDCDLNKKLAALSNISYTELRKLLVTAKPELLELQINYADNDNNTITGKGIEVDTMESLLNAPNNMDIRKTLRKTIPQHNDTEKGRFPRNVIYCLIDELKKRGITNDEMYNSMN